MSESDGECARDGRQTLHVGDSEREREGVLVRERREHGRWHVGQREREGERKREREGVFMRARRERMNATYPPPLFPLLLLPKLNELLLFPLLLLLLLLPKLNPPPLLLLLNELLLWTVE